MDTRIWCEFAKPLEVCSDHILDIFKKHDVTLNYRLDYGEDSSEFYKMLEIYNKSGIPVSIWATLSDDMGYWVNEQNAQKFFDYIKALLSRIESKGLKIKGLCIDMESPLEDIRRIGSPRNKLEPIIAYGRMLTSNLNKSRFKKSTDIFTDAACYIREKGLEGYATCIRHSYYDLRFGSELMQNALEIPVFKVPWDKYNLMYYATMIRNEMKKYKKVNVDYLIYHQVSYLKRILNDKLAVSVGVTNIGKLGNEPYYECMDDFEKDIGILKECGVEDFSLFSLDGIMNNRARLEEFLSRMKNAKPLKPEPCSRVIRNEALVGYMMNLGKLYYQLFR
ncbi:hypothetical protein [Lutispora saccharofermentans]|uniref:Uncharacterized protein n=1 Tax=Lutispora saccharofermentans TaxID=3024236 RepID=A0ABT1NH62_9FIRM|nr:hypothetical protein [Lutispora saccharofermentans]MCQ1530618.1 hypothetical protein [Lutispora saccharofermentans]